MTGVPRPIPYHLLDQIRGGIITGRYPPGSPLREQALETEFGASRGPVREALRLLELRGLVTHEPRRGFRVRNYTRETVQQIYRLRGLLERHSIESLLGREFGGLTQLLHIDNERMAAHFAAREITAYLDANVAFHQHILDFADNEPLSRSIGVLNEMAQPIRHALLSRDLGRSRAVAEHARIIELLERRDLHQAAVAMENHIVANLDAVRYLFD